LVTRVIEAGEKLAEIDSGREFGELGEVVGGEVFRIVVKIRRAHFVERSC